MIIHWWYLITHLMVSDYLLLISDNLLIISDYALMIFDYALMISDYVVMISDYALMVSCTNHQHRYWIFENQFKEEIVIITDLIHCTVGGNCMKIPKQVHLLPRQDFLTLTAFLNRRNKDRDFSIGVRAILTPNSKKNKRSPRRDISMKEINDTEMRGIGNKMFSNLEDDRRDSDVNDGSSFMVNIPKSISKTNLVEPDYMNEVRR